MVLIKFLFLILCIFGSNIQAKMTVLTSDRPQKAQPKKTMPFKEKRIEEKKTEDLPAPEPKKVKKSARKWQKKPERKKNKRKTVREMNYDELKEAKTKYLVQGDKATGMKFLEKMIPLCNDLEELRGHILELADLFFDHGDLEKAGKMYAEFTKLYPGNSKVEYASYKAILCSFYATLESDRDQTKTRETIDLAQTFLQRDVFTLHQKDVNSILISCRQKLLDSECNIFNFYLKRGSYKSAQKRIDGIRTEFAALAPEIEPQLLVLECELAQRQNKSDVLTLKQTELAQKFPTFKNELIAQTDTKKVSFVNKF